jgi:hypothetical protein
MSTEKGAVLVAAPTYAGKEYAIEAWKAAYDALDYEPRYAYQVDNTRVGLGYFERLKKLGISATHLTPWPDWDRTFKRCWELILARAIELDCYWIYSVEADNTPAPESLRIMVDMALAGNCHLVTHSYPMHESSSPSGSLSATSTATRWRSATSPRRSIRGSSTRWSGCPTTSAPSSRRPCSKR